MGCRRGVAASALRPRRGSLVLAPGGRVARRLRPARRDRARRRRARNPADRAALHHGARREAHIAIGPGDRAAAEHRRARRRGDGRRQVRHAPGQPRRRPAAARPSARHRRDRAALHDPVAQRADRNASRPRGRPARSAQLRRARPACGARAGDDRLRRRRDRLCDRSHGTPARRAVGPLRDRAAPIDRPAESPREERACAGRECRGREHRSDHRRCSSTERARHRGDARAGACVR